MSRFLLIALLTTGFFPTATTADELQTLPLVKAYKSPGWGCCEGWTKHLEDIGFVVDTQEAANMSQIKADYKIPGELQSCHTAIVDGYVLEGHVPKDEVLRLLRERPNAIGLTVPGMPIGSPGMEVPGRIPDPYQVLIIDKQGNAWVYAEYPKK